MTLAASCGGTGNAGDGRRMASGPVVTLPDGTAVAIRQLTPFRDCLRDHGVSGQPFGRAPATPLPTQAEMRVRVTCAAKLPPRLDRLYLRLSHRIAR